MTSTIDKRATFRPIAEDFWVMRQWWAEWGKQTQPVKSVNATVTTAPGFGVPLATADIRYLSSIIGQVEELLNEPESDEHGTLRADSEACLKARELLVDAAIVSAREYDQRTIPYGCASTDSEGGIRIEWVRPSTGVRLVVPAVQKHGAYIYHEAGDAFHVEPATSEALARWLREIN
jgi:hypothetical protein